MNKCKYFLSYIVLRLYLTWVLSRNSFIKFYIRRERRGLKANFVGIVDFPVIIEDFLDCVVHLVNYDTKLALDYV